MWAIIRNTIDLIADIALVVGCVGLFLVLVLVLIVILKKRPVDPVRDKYIASRQCQNPNVFISFHREDLLLAQQCVAELRASAFEPLLTFDPNEIPADIVEIIVPRILKAAFLVRINPERAISRWVEAEVRLAEIWKIPVVTISDYGQLTSAISQLRGLGRSVDYGEQFDRLVSTEALDDVLRVFNQCTSNAGGLRVIEESDFYGSEWITYVRAWAKPKESKNLLLLLAVLGSFGLGWLSLILVSTSLVAKGVLLLVP